MSLFLDLIASYISSKTFFLSVKRFLQPSSTLVKEARTPKRHLWMGGVPTVNVPDEYLYPLVSLYLIPFEALLLVHI